MVGSLLAPVAAKPTPVRVAPALVSAVIACVPRPARPVPAGVAAVQAAAGAAPPGSSHTTTSWAPDRPYVPAAVKPPPAPVSAVTSATPPSGTGSNLSDHDAPPFAETATN